MRGGVILEPFKLDHGNNISRKIFVLKESFHRMLVHRNDLELQFVCYHNDDKQTLCNWPQGVIVSINEQKLHIDRVSGGSLLSFVTSLLSLAASLLSFDASFAASLLRFDVSLLSLCVAG